MRWLVLLLVLLGGGVQSQEPAPCPAKADQKPQAQTASCSKHSDPEKKSIVGSSEKKSSEKADQKNQESLGNWWSRSEWWLVAFNGLLVVVVFLQWFWMTRQEIWMRKSFKAARLAANAGMAQATASEQTIKTMERTAKNELRAYLGVRSGKFTHLGDCHLQAIVEIHNTGSTPAHRVTKAIDIDVRDSKNPGAFKMPETHKGKGPIVPGAWWTFRIDKTVPREVFDEIVKYEKSIFVWGRAEYDDIFGKPQVLEFRFRNLAAHQTRTPEYTIITGWDLEPEEDGNTST